MIALSIFRQLATLRPVAFLGQYSRRIGSIRRHISSGISQIVPRGWRRDFRRAIAKAPIVVLRNGVARYNLLPAKGVPPVLGQFLSDALAEKD
jgi:hypothetical protein